MQRGVESTIVPDSVETRDRQARLRIVDFPGVDVECRRLTPIGRLAEGAANQPKRKLTQIPAAGGGNGVTQYTDRRQGKLGELPARTTNEVRNTRCGRVPVSTSMYRKETRIIHVTFLDQCIECPLEAGNNGKVGCAITKNARTRDLLERFSRGSQVFAKLRGSQRGNALVSKAVRCYFMTGRRNCPDHFRPVLREPPKRKEGSSRAIPIETREELIDASCDSRRSRQPFVA